MRVLSSPSVLVLKASHDHSMIHFSSCIFGEQDKNYHLRGRPVVFCRSLVWWAKLLLYPWRWDRDLIFFISEPKIHSSPHKTRYHRFNTMALAMTHFKLMCQNLDMQVNLLLVMSWDWTGPKLPRYFICRARDAQLTKGKVQGSPARCHRTARRAQVSGKAFF